MAEKKSSTETKARRKKLNPLYVALPILAALVIGIGAAWLLVGRNDTGPEGTEIQLAPASQLSDKVRQAPPIVQEAYRFAVANPELLEQFPCYCSCGSMSHKSNLNCFVREFHADGSITFDDHALG